MYRIENPAAFYLFVFVAILLFVYFLYRLWYKKSLGLLADSHLIDFIAVGRSNMKNKLKFILALTGIVLIIIAIVNIQVGSKVEKKAQAETIDVMLAFDISHSMLAEDIKPGRLQRARMFATLLTDKLKGAKIGIVVFAGDAFVHMPLTIDKGAIRMFINSITTDMLSAQGTAIGRAVQLSIEAFERTDAKNKAIVLISDGENFESDPIPFAKLASKENIVIHTAIFGTDQGGPIPIKVNDKLTGFKQDKEGNTVITKPDKVLLHQIATTTGGIAVDGGLLNESVSEVVAELKKLDREVSDTIIFSDYSSLYMFFVIPALLLLLLDFLTLERKMKWQEKLKDLVRFNIKG